MKIVFAGQLKITGRVAALAQRLAQAGHEVTVYAARPRIRHWGRVEVRPRASSIVTIWDIYRHQPDVVHMHGWRMAALSYVVAMAAPTATLVWTVDALPAWPSGLVRGVARMAARVFDVITVPRRDVQYQLLEAAGVRALYVPDGFAPANISTLSPRRWGLWPGRYIVVTASTAAEEAAVRQAYAATGSKRALIAVSNTTSTERVRAALFARAAAIVLFDHQESAETILQAMASGKPIVAAAWPFYEEILGTTARYVKPSDRLELTKILRQVFKAKAATGRSAGKQRAEKHFSWERILADYMPLYRPSERLILLDSACRELSIPVLQ